MLALVVTANVTRAEAGGTPGASGEGGAPRRELLCPTEPRQQHSLRAFPVLAPTDTSIICVCGH